MENRIWEIIAASIHGEELSQEEISTLQVWLDENKQNRDEYARLQIFYAENKGGLKDNINVQRAWDLQPPPEQYVQELAYDQTSMC